MWNGIVRRLIRKNTHLHVKKNATRKIYISSKLVEHLTPTIQNTITTYSQTCSQRVHKTSLFYSVKWSWKWHGIPSTRCPQHDFNRN